MGNTAIFQSEFKLSRISSITDNSILVETDDLYLEKGTLPIKYMDSGSPLDTEFDYWEPKKCSLKGELQLVWNKDNSRHKIEGEGSCQYHQDMFIHYLGWVIGDKVLDPESGRIIANNEYPLERFIDIINKKYFVVPKSDILEIRDFSNKTFWSIDISELDIRREFFWDRYYVIMARKRGIFGIDVNTGKVLWWLKHRNEDVTDYFTKPIISDKYFWCHASDFMGENKLLYRIAIENGSIEILEYDIQSIDRAQIVDDKLIIIKNDHRDIVITNMNTGIVESNITLNTLLPNLRSSYSSYNDHPLICNAGGNPFLLNMQDINKPILVSSKPIQINKRDYYWHGWDNYYCMDDNYIYGINTRNGNRTWYIRLDQLGDDPEVVMADEKAVLIGHGEDISIFGVNEH